MVLAAKLCFWAICLRINPYHTPNHLDHLNPFVSVGRYGLCLHFCGRIKRESHLGGRNQ